jgi:integrase
MPKRTDKDGLYQRKDSPWWWASYIDGRGKRTRRSTGTADQREAAALLSKWRLDAHREREWGEEPAREYDELMLLYLRGPSKRKRAHGRDVSAARNLTPHFTGRDLRGLSPSDVRAYIDGRLAAGVGPGTVNREVGLLSAAINYARRELDWSISNPAAGRRMKEPEGRVRYLSRAEAENLIAAARSEPQAKHLEHFIALALNTGCRRDELLRLRWSDVVGEMIVLEGMATKSGRRRSVPLNASARGALAALRAFRAEHCKTSPWVFAREDGTRIASVKRSWATACRRAGITNFRVHDMRHTCAAWLVSAGVPLPEVRDLLGHSTIRMTERYAHLAPENVRAAVAVLDTPGSRSGHARLRVVG